MLNNIFELKFADLLFIGPLISQLAFRTKDFGRYLLSTSERFVSNTLCFSFEPLFHHTLETNTSSQILKYTGLFSKDPRSV